MGSSISGILCSFAGAGRWCRSAVTVELMIYFYDTADLAANTVLGSKILTNFQ